jgi:demethylmenaquinone methyltransferase/2-methoxy-6-polyprenyl-1,4-benzoquinol methylase
VEYVTADLFSWRPAERFDFVFFAFWFSHVPRSRFDVFWDLVASALSPSGKAFFIDSKFHQESRAQDHPPIDREGRAIRRLNDGREFEIIKEYYQPQELEAELHKRGWQGYVRASAHFFIYGCLSR